MSTPTPEQMHSLIQSNSPKPSQSNIPKPTNSQPNSNQIKKLIYPGNRPVPIPATHVSNRAFTPIRVHSITPDISSHERLRKKIMESQSKHVFRPNWNAIKYVE